MNIELSDCKSKLSMLINKNHLRKTEGDLFLKKKFYYLFFTIIHPVY